MKVAESFKHEDILGLKFGYSPIGQPNLFVHIYFVDGLLIDTGQFKLSKHIISATENLSVNQIFITHHHEDHTGNIPVLRRMHNCIAYAPELTCQIMKNPPALSFVQKLYYGQRGADQDLTPIDNFIETDKYHFDIIPIPGHAVDMVALYEQTKKWLFSADLYVNSYIGYFLRNESVLHQIESIRNILKLDFDVMFCAHNPQMTNGKQQLTKKLNFLESFYEDVSALHQKGRSALEIFKELDLKENWLVRTLSGGQLSKLNMVKSVIRDLGN